MSWAPSPATQCPRLRTDRAVGRADARPWQADPPPAGPSAAGLASSRATSFALNPPRLSTSLRMAPATVSSFPARTCLAMLFT